MRERIQAGAESVGEGRAESCKNNRYAPAFSEMVLFEQLAHRSPAATPNTTLQKKS
jgi:hypothetical protein